MNIFEYGAKNKVRFNTDVGRITVEDLYDLPLDSDKKVSLNSVAKTVNAELKSSEEESFVATVTAANTEAQTKLDIVKHIISQRLTAVEAKRTLATTNARKALIAGILEEKQNDSLRGMSVEELQAELRK